MSTKTFRKLSEDKYVKTVIDEKGKETKVEIPDEEKPVEILVSNIGETTIGYLRRFLKELEMQKEQLTAEIANTEKQITEAKAELAEAEAVVGITTIAQ